MWCLKVVFCLLLVATAVMCQDFSNDFFLPQGQQVMVMMPNGRNSRGPVVFPTSPEGTETSGVIIGASGYGFVPPGSQRRLPVYNIRRPVIQSDFARLNFGRFF